MQPDDQPLMTEAHMLAVTTKRMAERATKAYEHLKGIIPANDEEAAALNNARLNMASVREAAEILRDLYTTTIYQLDREGRPLPPMAAEKLHWWQRIMP